MKKNTITIKILSAIIAVVLFMLSILVTLEYLSHVLLYQTGSIIEYIKYFINFMLLTVIPFLAFFCAVTYFYLRPMQKTINDIEANIKVEESRITQTKKIILRLPFFLTIMNTLGFVGGFILFAYQNNYLTHILSFEVFLYFLFTFSEAAIYAFLQTTIINQILVKTRELLNIYYIDDKITFKELSLRNKVIIMFFLIIIYIITFVMHKDAIYYKNKNLYTNLMESVVKNEISLDQARENYKKDFFTLGTKQDIIFPYDNNKKILDYNIYVIITSLSLIFIGLTLVIAFSKELIIQINLQRQTMKKILEGSEKLTKKINIIQFDEIGRLTDIINTFIDKFRLILENASQSSEVVSDSSKTLDSNIYNASSAIQEMVASIAQITQNTVNQKSIVDETNNKIQTINDNIDKISNNIIEQSNFVEETANAMTEMASSINSVTDLTINANNLGNNLVNTVNKGVVSIENAIDAIKKIEESSDHVMEIVGTLNSIAGKTNLLAMNASIEAAHAGQFGHGFTIVANEIRKLSEDSNEQASQIIQYIKDMNEKVKHGVTMAQDSAKAFQMINNDVITTTSHINEITNAMQEQRISTNEILSAISSVLNATENTKETTMNLKEKSQEIKKQMEELFSISIHINTATEEQNKSNKELIDLINKAKEISNINLEVVNKLKLLLNNYNLKSINV